MMKLREDCVALVTGVGGIGGDIAETFAREGARVLVIDIDKEVAETRAQKIIDAGGQAVATVGNISVKADCQRFVATAMEKWGKVDVLVNSAAVLRDKSIRNMTEDEWDLVLDVGLKGTFLMTQAVVEIMREQKFGRVINLTSPAFNGNFGQANYSASKGGVNSLTRCTAVEYARFNVTANAIAPGVIDTPLNRSLPPEVFERIVQMTPTKKAGLPSDISACALFLASEEAHYITGQIIFVDGGISIPH